MPPFLEMLAGQGMQPRHVRLSDGPWPLLRPGAQGAQRAAALHRAQGAGGMLGGAGATAGGSAFKVKEQLITRECRLQGHLRDRRSNGMLSCVEQFSIWTVVDAYVS